MKETGTSHWSSPNTGATNSSGFTALPGGYRDIGGYFESIGGKDRWWSTTELSSTFSWAQALSYNSSEVHPTCYDNGNGFSVRCIED